jgi:Kef-type K+ transport system membrane component KefB
MPATHWILGAFCHGMMFSKTKGNEKIRMITKHFRENPNPK